MPTVTRTIQRPGWAMIPPDPINRGHSVRVLANRDVPYSDDNVLGEGVIAGWYNDTQIGSRVYVVLFDSPLQLSMSEGPYSADRLGGPVSLSRLVVHRDALAFRQTGSETETIECPPCAVCGEPAHGDAVGSIPQVSYCDECAIDLDVELRTWPEIRERQVRAEEEVAATSPRRRRQAADRVAAIREGETDSPHPAQEYVDTVAAQVNETAERLEDAVASQRARDARSRTRRGDVEF